MVLLVAGAAVVASVSLSPLFAGPADAGSLTVWQAYARGLVTFTIVNLDVPQEGGPLPVGLRVNNSASVPIAISEYPVLMSPSPIQSPAPNPLDTTQDAVLTNGTVPAKGSLMYAYGEYVAAGFLTGPSWWCMEEMQFPKAGVVFALSGQTLPYGLRPVVEQPFFHTGTDNTQTALYRDLRSSPAVVVSKEPLWTTVPDAAGQKIRVRIDATNMAVWSTQDAITADVNVTGDHVQDVVPAGWSVEGGSFSTPGPTIVTNADGSQTLTWSDSLPAAHVSDEDNPLYPTDYLTVTHAYTLVSPALTAGSLDMPRATSDINGDGKLDARSAPVAFTVVSANAPPVADAGGPYAGKEGDTILLSASASRDPDGDPLQYRWSFADNGTWDTAWSSSPTASVRYTDEFTGHARVEVSDGHSTSDATAAVAIDNVPPTITNLAMSASADFRLLIAGVKGQDLTLTVHAGGTVLATVKATREPGDPESTAADTGPLAVDLTRPVSAEVVYAPHEGGGRGIGDNPGTLVITLPGGGNVTMVHNFNVNHPSTWTWDTGDLRGSFRSHGIAFSAHLHDPGSDTLTAFWDFGDGTNQIQVFPNGPAGDTPEDVTGGVSPFDVTASVAHAYPTAGTYTVVLRVSDPDGGVATASLTVTWS